MLSAISSRSRMAASALLEAVSSNKMGEAGLSRLLGNSRPGLTMAVKPQWVYYRVRDSTSRSGRRTKALCKSSGSLFEAFRYLIQLYRSILNMVKMSYYDYIIILWDPMHRVQLYYLRVVQPRFFLL